jgi:uncharacterized protein (DUF2267 family)
MFVAGPVIWSVHFMLVYLVVEAGCSGDGPGLRLFDPPVPTVVTLAERMSHDELLQLGARLPAELQVAVRAGSPGCQPFGADEFVRRVAERVGVEPQTVWTDVRAVLGTLEREVAEMEAVRQRLPREFDALMA